MGGLGGKRGGPEFLLLGGKELGTGGGGSLGGDGLGTANKKQKIHLYHVQCSLCFNTSTVHVQVSYPAQEGSALRKKAFLVNFQASKQAAH